MISLIITIIISGICGWLAGIIMKQANSTLMNIIIGIVGGAIGGVVFGLIGIGPTNIIGKIFCGVVGSCILLAVVNVLKKK